MPVPTVPDRRVPHRPARREDAHTDDHGQDGGQDVELRRNHGSLVLPAVCVLGGVVLLALPSERSLLRNLVAIGAVALGGVVLLGALRPFRFGIGPDGITVRRPGLRRLIRWTEIQALVLDAPPPVAGVPAPPRLLVVPAPGVALGAPATARHPVDGRPAVELLDLGQVRERPDDVAAALARHGGERFVDLLARRRAAFPVDDLTMGLRGYETNPVDRLIRQGQEALAWGGAPERQAARAGVEQARAAGLTVAARGYSTAQVDEALRSLSAALADDRTTDREPST
ncbi:hypothetical protein [Micromonospora globbae]|uniref:hypothetical protein n=1 Tax=Micromonospora globbae TaxID=1894969 RepID=UPI00386359B2|nr:hypothetical protein OH732_25240 [Micromonospora globbae]